MRIAILEDDIDQLAELIRVLEADLLADDVPIVCEGFRDGEALQRALRYETFDILILDWNVPGLAGIELLQWVRAWQKDNPPVLMLSSRSSERDVVQALSCGASDYIVKPFRPLELRARILRMVPTRALVVYAPTEQFGRWELDHSTRSIRYHEATDGVAPEELDLTEREFRLALVLFRNIGRVISRAYLLEGAGFPTQEMPTRTLDSHIYRLRKKIQLDATRGMTLLTVYGHGYRLQAVHTKPASV